MGSFDGLPGDGHQGDKNCRESGGYKNPNADGDPVIKFGQPFTACPPGYWCGNQNGGDHQFHKVSGQAVK